MKRKFWNEKNKKLLILSIYYTYIHDLKNNEIVIKK